MEGFRRHFLIPFSTVPSRAAKAFDGRSRADVMCRCIVNSLMVSANTRNDTCIACVLLGTPDLQPATLLCCGKHMRALHPTEKTVAGIVQVRARDLVSKDPAQSHTQQTHPSAAASLSVAAVAAARAAVGPARHPEGDVRHQSCTEQQGWCLSHTAPPVSLLHSVPCHQTPGTQATSRN